MLGILIFGMLNNNLLRNFGQELGGPECSRSCNCIREACRRCKTLPPPKERRALRSPDRYRPAYSRKTTTHDACYSTDKQDISKKNRYSTQNYKYPYSLQGPTFSSYHHCLINLPNTGNAASAYAVSNAYGIKWKHHHRSKRSDPTRLAWVITTRDVNASKFAQRAPGQ